MKKLFTLIYLPFVFANHTTAQIKIPIGEVSTHIGEIVTICDKVFDGKFLESSKTHPTLLNMGGTYPNHKLTILISLEDRKNFEGKPEDAYTGKNVCVTGKLIDFKGKPEIVVGKPEEIKIDETRQGSEIKEQEK